MAFITGLAATACGQGPETDAVSIGAGAPIGSPSSSSCATPSAGCACSPSGKTADCGQVVQHYGNYVACSIGTTTCTDGVWGPCQGDRVTTQALPSGDLNLLSLGRPGVCTTNPCDPYCNIVVDTPTGIDAGSAFTLSDGGLTLAPTAPPTHACTSLAITPNTSPATDLVITSMAPSPNTVSFTATLSPAGCYTGPVPALWSVDKYNIAQISATGLMTVVNPIAGNMTVSAFAGTLVATPVVSHVTVNIVDTSAAPPGYTASSFPSATPGTADHVTVLYPYGPTVGAASPPPTVFPLGLPAPLIQWSNGGVNANAVKITVRYPASGAIIFSWSEIISELSTAPTPTLPGQPRASIPQAVWNDFQQTAIQNGTAPAFDGAFAIQRIVGATVLNEVATRVRFANDQLKGNVYYNSYGTNLVQNYQPTFTGARFGAATLSVPFNGLTPTVVAGFTSPVGDTSGCRVCHTVSADGNVLETNHFTPNDLTSGTFNLTIASPPETALGPNPGSGQFSWPALSPDGTYLFTNSAAGDGQTSNLGSAELEGATNSFTSKLFTINATAIASATAPTTLKAATPAFSPDAAHIAFNFYGGTATPLANPTSGVTTGDQKTLSMMDFAPPSTFSHFRNLYSPATGLAVWPAFLPPGQNGLVFEHEIVNNGRDWGGTRSQCDQSNPAACQNAGTTAEIWWVSTGATPTAEPLANLNGVGYLPTGPNLHGSPSNATYYDQVYNYEPTVLPIAVGGYSWVVFTSRRMYGNVATINPYWSDPRFQNLSVQPTPRKLWVAAVSTSPTPGTDPSYPAFYLPGQELLAGNGRAFFALTPCEAAGPPTSANICTSDLDCCGAPTTAACVLDVPLTNPPVSHCVTLTSSMCSADGATCTTDASCCNFATGSRCASGTCQVPPPIYVGATYTRLYTSDCPSATHVRWEIFQWKSITPANTKIVFTAQTGNSPGTYGAPVNVGIAQAPPVTTAAWTSDGQTIDAALAASDQPDDTLLLLTATFVPTLGPPAAAPTLTDWDVTFDCPPSE